MAARLVMARHLFLTAGAAAMLAGCAATPLGPTVQAMPGPGKTFDAFQTDNTSCKGFAASQVQGQADAANQRAAGAAVLGTVLAAGLGAAVGGSVGDAATGAAIGAATGLATGTGYGAAGNANDQAMIQQQYDNAFMQCMYAKGERVPGFAPVASAAPPPPVAEADPMVRSTQHELIRLGYLHDTADGYMGPKTRAAISSFQQSHAMSVTGAPSPALLAQLQSTPTHMAASSPSAATSPAASAQAPSNWVAPAATAAGVTPAASPAPAAPSGWVAPTKQ